MDSFEHLFHGQIYSRQILGSIPHPELELSNYGSSWLNAYFVIVKSKSIKKNI